MNERLKNKFKNLTNALNRLKEVLENKDTEFTIKRDSTIQRFEFTIELFWKFLKTYMEEMGVNEESIKFPRDILVKSYENNLITDEKVWINMMFDRNKTSHIYDEEEANKIYHNIENNYFPVMRDNYESIKKRLELL